MNLELKNIKLHQDLSEETWCYTASLYVDGNLEAHVGNRGCGGCDDYHMSVSYTLTFDQINNWCKQNLPKWQFDGKDHDTDLEMWCAKIIDKFNYEKQKKRVRTSLKRMMNKNLVLIEKSSEIKEECDVYTVKKKPNLDYDSESVKLATCKRLDKDYTILNYLPFEDAFKLYLANPINMDLW
jgi:hypothetical protein